MTCPKSPMFARSNPPANEDRDLMMGEKLSDSALDTIFRTARTYNGYTDEPVTQDQIRQIYDLLKMGPTSANQQPARFVWLLSQAAKDKLADCATGTNPDKIRQAPAAVGIGMEDRKSTRLNSRHYCESRMSSSD